MLINGVTLPGDGFPIQRVVMNILQLIESGKPAASCSPQLSVWIKKQSRPYEPRYHGFARMTVKYLVLYFENRDSETTIEECRCGGESVKKERGKSYWVVLAEHS